jgi:hypothetical protein
MPRHFHHNKTLVDNARLRMCCVFFGLALVVSGCAAGTTRKTASVRSAKGVEVSAAEFSSRNQSLLALYSGEVETAADKIISESRSPVTRRQALVWKAEAIPVMQTTLLNTDPVAAVFDTWVFLFQMKAYMERPAVQQAFGESHSVVADTLKNMDAEMERLVLAAAPSADIADMRQKAKAWAEAHPVQESLAGRQSADPLMIRRVGQDDLGTRASIKRVGESLGDFAARLNSYNTYVPRQARWQAEILLSDLSLDPQVQAAMSNIAVLSSSLEKASGSMEHMPELMGQVRQAVVGDVDSQRLAVQAFLQQERLEALAEVNEQRIATLAAMRSERLAATGDLRGERQIVLDAIRNDQREFTSNLNVVTENAIKDIDARGRSLIDHFFIRALELVLITLALCSLVAWLLFRRLSGGRRDRGERLYDRAA